MAYQVIKTINGKKYLYSQSTYREGGKVKTISHYIGAVDGSTGILTTPDDDPHHERPTKTAETVEQVLNPEAPKPEKTDEKPLILQTPVLKLNFHGLKVSKSALLQEHYRTAQKLKRYDINPAHFPKITAKHGAEYQHYKPMFRDGLTITAPNANAKGGREKLRREYRKALHRGFIETLERQAPERIAPFRYAFDQAYRDTHKALNTYLWNCNSEGSFARVLALKFFSVMNPVPTGKNKKLPPEKLGLIDYGKREDWKADFCEIMAEIDRKGIRALHNRAKVEIAKAEAGQRELAKKRTLFFIRKRKSIKRQQARIEANRAMLYKLHLVQKFGLT